ncbi:MAG TPA: ABC transporter permease [Candidatus Omnitrophota bacterium]|nr:ABC transporter permease [Candidatus Omnitrophota bacterium]
MIKNPIGFATFVRREVLRFFVVFSQTILPPIASSTLYIFIFGFSVGRSLNLEMGGVTYIQFIVPGLVMMHLIDGSYANTSSSLFMSRWHNLIQDFLLSPLTYFEMVLGLMIGGMARGMLVATGVYGVSLFFTQFYPHNIFLVIFFYFTVTMIFSCVGMIVALWAEGFEKLSLWSSFVITPLIYFGGVFHSVKMLPAPLQFLAYLNPVFYFVGGMRYALLGISDVDVRIAMGVALFMAATLFVIVERLFKAGYKLRT